MNKTQLSYLTNRLDARNGVPELYARLDDLTIRLDACDGVRYEEGKAYPCVPGCVAHFDGKLSDPFDDYNSAYPSSILSSVPNMRGSKLEATYVAPMWWYERLVTVHLNGHNFFDSNGAPVPIWVVILHPDSPDLQFFAAFGSRLEAASLVAEATALDAG